MKNPFIAMIVGVLALGGVAVGYLKLNEPTEAVNVKVEKEMVEVHPDWSTDEEAVQAAKDVIQRKAWEADKERLEGQIEALQSELDEVDKSLGLY